mmetsp:Transcript_36011/g.67049  ORF Transcript_36011/g.67049 Transcript_36011/m.67049 type:complete len:269 (-) Transcript_36011:7-813(-)
MADHGPNLPQAIQLLELAIDVETDTSVLRALRQRVVQKVMDRLERLEAFPVTIRRPSGDARQITGCLPDDTLESLCVRAATGFGLPQAAVLLCRGSRQFRSKDMHMSLSDLGIGDSSELTCLYDTGCRSHWRLRIAEESCEWEAIVHEIELYDESDARIPREAIETITCDAERNALNVASNAFDGTPDTFWETTFGSQKIGGSIFLTFREAVALRRVRFRQHPNQFNALRAVELLSSDDGLAWRHRWTANSLGGGWGEAKDPNSVEWQ